MVGLKRVRNASHVAGAGISYFVMSMFEASDVEGLQISQHGYLAGIMSRGGCRSSYASAQLFRGRRSIFEASMLKSLKPNVILKSSLWSTCHFGRKSRRKALFLTLSCKASFLKEVAQKVSVFEFQNSFLKEVSQKVSFLS